MSLLFAHSVKTLMEKYRSTSSPFFLNLDTSVSIPIVLRNASQSIPESLSLNMVSNGTPGKFYGAEAALGLLGAIRAGGSSVLVDVDQGASPEDKKGFSHFSSRLQAGNLVSLNLFGKSLSNFENSSWLLREYKSLSFFPPAIPF